MDILYLFLNYVVNLDFIVCFVIKVNEKVKRFEIIMYIIFFKWWFDLDMEMNIIMIYS